MTRSGIRGSDGHRRTIGGKRRMSESEREGFYTESRLHFKGRMAGSDSYGRELRG